MRFVKDHFDEYRESTIGGKFLLPASCSAALCFKPFVPVLLTLYFLLHTAAFLAQTISLDDNTIVKFEIWYDGS